MRKVAEAEIIAPPSEQGQTHVLLLLRCNNSIQATAHGAERTPVCYCGEMKSMRFYAIFAYI